VIPPESRVFPSSDLFAITPGAPKPGAGLAAAPEKFTNTPVPSRCENNNRLHGAAARASAEPPPFETVIRGTR
jgi:hypothetical protein